MRINLPYVDRIWRVRNTLPLEDGIGAGEAFERLDPLLQTEGTHYTIEGDTLSYTKENPAAQDKLATFTRGTLTVAEENGRRVLAYDLSSTALALCFLAPLFFMALAFLAMGLNTLHPADPDREGKEESEEARPDPRLHWIDQMFGAPAPETKEEREQRRAEERRDGEKEKKEFHASTPAFVLAGIFAAIYAVGRLLEPYLMRRTLRTALRGGFIATPSGPRLRDPGESEPRPETEGEISSHGDVREAGHF
jgi:hypothetical protein